MRLAACPYHRAPRLDAALTHTDLPLKTQSPRLAIRRASANSRTKFARAVGVLLAFTTSVVSAEELPSIEVTPLREAAPPADALEPTVSSLPTIEVFARLKPEDAQRAPLAISVLGGERFKASGMRTTQDFQGHFPGLTVATPNPRQTAYTIRGLGSSGANEGLEGSVGVLIDGVYLGRQGLTSFDLFDLDQVEVLRGPQGTYFGKNTTAGVIHVRTRAPSVEPGAELTLGLGSENLRTLQGFVTGGLDRDGDWSARVSGYATARDGTIDNRFDEREFLGQSRQGLRGQLLYAPASGIRNRSIVEWGRVRDDCCVFQLNIYRPAIQSRDDYMEYQREPVDPFARQVQLDSRIALEQDQLGLTNELTLPLDGAWSLTSTSAYRSWEFEPFNDDGASLNISPLNGTLNDYRQLSQELRLEGQWGATRLLGGLYALDQDLDARDRFIIGDEFIPWVLGGAVRSASGQDLTRSNADFGLGAAGRAAEGSDNQTLIDQRTRSQSVFASIDHDFNPRWSAGAGVRYTQERKTASVVRRRLPPPGGDPGALDDPLALDDQFFEAFGTTDPGTLTVNVLLDQIVGGASQRENRYREGAWSGQAHLQRNLGDSATAYLRLARGAKAGGINLAPVSGMVNPTFKPETINSAELGFKGGAFSDRVRIDLAVYHAQVRDYQALTFDREPSAFPNPRPVNLINVGAVRLQGAEVDLALAPLPSLRFFVGAAYTRAITEDFTNAPDEATSTNTKDLSGQPLYNAPRWTTRLGVEGDLPFWSAANPTAGIEWSYRSDTFGTVERGVGSEIDGYSLVNLRLGFADKARDWRVEALLRNALDEDYLVAVGSLYGIGNYGATVGEPRRFELSLVRSF